MDDTFTLLRQLCGAWVGVGEATFPTIGTYEYRERLRFTADFERPLLFYEQQAEVRDPDSGAFRPSHWEAGFLVVTGSGQVRLTNAQSNGRLELLELTVDADPIGLRLAGSATGHFNDPRMKGAYREYVLSGDALRYRMEMVTTTVASRALHLAATLRREAS
jgi:nitrobindin-like protein